MSAIQTAARISEYLTTGMHHSTPEARAEIAKLIAAHDPVPKQGYARQECGHTSGPHFVVALLSGGRARFIHNGVAFDAELIRVEDE